MRLWLGGGGHAGSATGAACSSLASRCVGGGVVGGLDVGLAAASSQRLVLGAASRARTWAVMFGVVAPAQLGALAGEELPAACRDLEPGVVGVAGDGVELAAELRDPPGVRDVLGVDVERDRRVRPGRPSPRRRRRVQRRVGAVVGVGVAPDVLLAVDADVQRLAVGRQLLGRPTAKSVPLSASWRPSAPEFGGLRMPPSLTKVKTASTTRISAAPTVQPISRRVLPRIWAATAPLRARNLTSE